MTSVPLYRLDVERPEPVPAPFRGSVLAIGSFDGVHRGHQALITLAAARARSFGTRPAALTFEPHPRAVLQPDAPMFRLSEAPARRLLLGLAGAEAIVEAAFTTALAGLEPETFVRAVLIDRLAARGVVVGEGFRFGRKRAGDCDMLRQIGGELGFALDILPPVTDDFGSAVSSGRVREALARGDIAGANALLGYRWFVTGTVVAGDRRGRELGYPTANIRPPPGLTLRHGIYAVAGRWPGGSASGVASFGVRPTFGGGEPLLEVHLFDRGDDLYGQEMTVTFLAWLRAEERFDSMAALIAQMDADSREARAIHAGTGDGTRIDRALAARA